MPAPIRRPATSSVSSHLDALRDRLDSCGSALSRSPRPSLVRDLVEAQLEVPIALRDAAEAASLEYTSFSRHFHRSIEVTFSGWLAMLRVARAAELLRDTELPVAVIAQRVGFGRASSLRKAFRRLIGISPREHRRRCKGDSR